MKALSGKRFLIVDDEKLLREVMRDELIEAGSIECEETDNGIDALRMVQEKSYDAVITDVRMSKGNGLTLLDSIVKLPRRPLVFIITGYGDITKEEAQRRGARDLMSKPFDPDDLVQTVRKAIFR